MHRTVTDRLLDLCEQQSEEIAKRWYQDVHKSPRKVQFSGDFFLQESEADVFRQEPI